MTAHMMPALVRLYPARVLNFVDGDTCRLDISLGFGVSYAGTNGQGIRCRLAFVNSPEIATDAGKAAALYTRDWLSAAAKSPLVYPLLVESHIIDNYGRPLVTIFRVSDGRCLNDDLLADGQAVPMAIARQVAMP